MPSDVLIRPARPADVPGIITLSTAVAEERDSIGTEPGFDAAMFNSVPGKTAIFAPRACPVLRKERVVQSDAETEAANVDQVGQTH